MNEWEEEIEYEDPCKGLQSIINEDYKWITSNIDDRL